MKRKELAFDIANVIHGDVSWFINYDPEDDEKVNRILRIIDHHVIDELMRNKELEVNKIDLKGQPLLPTPTCPGCGSKDYVVTGGPGGNCKCNRCGRNYFFCFSSSYGI